jgi:hypothetical protein
MSRPNKTNDKASDEKSSELSKATKPSPASADNPGAGVPAGTAAAPARDDRNLLTQADIDLYLKQRRCRTKAILDPKNFKTFMMLITTKANITDFDTDAMAEHGYDRRALEMFGIAYQSLEKSHPFRYDVKGRTQLDLSLIKLAAGIERDISAGEMKRSEAVAALTDDLASRTVTITEEPTGLFKCFKAPREVVHNTHASQLGLLAIHATEERISQEDAGTYRGEDDWDADRDIIGTVNRRFSIVS